MSLLSSPGSDLGSLGGLVSASASARLVVRRRRPVAPVRPAASVAIHLGRCLFTVGGTRPRGSQGFESTRGGERRVATGALAPTGWKEHTHGGALTEYRNQRDPGVGALSHPLAPTTALFASAPPLVPSSASSSWGASSSWPSCLLHRPALQLGRHRRAPPTDGGDGTAVAQRVRQQRPSVRHRLPPRPWRHRRRRVSGGRRLSA